MKQPDTRRTPIFRRVVEGPIYRFSRWVIVISGIAAIIIMVLTTADILMRRFLDMPIRGGLEITSALLVVLGACSFAWIMTEKGHIVVNLVTSKYPQRLRGVILSIALFLSLIMVGLICWGSILFGLQEFRIGEASVLIGIPMAPIIFMLAFGSVLLGLVILVQFINSFTRAKED